jgi:O-succinylbenzoic acid--CoA ligase
VDTKMTFDLNHHFLTYEKNLFLKDFDNNRTYADLLSDVSAFSNFFQVQFNSASPLGVKTKSPYNTLVAILAAYSQRKMVVLLSHLSPAPVDNMLRKEFSFEAIIDDNHFTDLKKSKTSCHFPSSFEDSPFVIVFSSGTTSSPKGVALSFNNLYFSAKGFIDYFNFLESECTLINLPHHHVGGLMSLWRAFFAGGSITLDSNASVDCLSLVPVQLNRILDSDKKLSQLQNCRIILIGGAPLSDKLKERAAEKNITLYETYGMSESTSLIMVNGVVLPYREVLLDDDGFFLLRGKTIFKGYYQNLQFIPNEQEVWFKTKDIGLKNDQGHFEFLRRADLIFISGGENINPLSVEEIVKGHPLISDACLIGLPDKEWGHVGVLLYEFQNEFNENFNDELKKYLKQNLHPHHIPKYFFQTKLKIEGQLKPNRSELRILAEKQLLRSLFSYDYLETPNKPLMVLLHGFLGDKEDLKAVGLNMIEDYSLLFIDLPGHGNTLCKNFHSKQDVLQKLALLIKTFNVSPILYGYSMGGRIALNLSLHYLIPRALILESAGLGLQTTEEQRARAELDLQRFNSFTSALEFLKAWYELPLFSVFKNHPNFGKDILRRSNHNINEWKNSELWFSQGVFPLQSETLKRLEAATFPVLYLYGEEDPAYKQQSRFFRHSSEIKGAGHNPNKTHPIDIIDCLRRSLKLFDI